MPIATKSMSILKKGSLSPSRGAPNLSFSGMQSRERASLPDVQSDLVVQVDGVGFALHKFVLSSRSGRIKKLVDDYKGPEPYHALLSHVPGGPDAFELAAKICYGIKVEVEATNVVALRCVAEFLEMTEQYCEGNLISCTELFLKEVVLKSFEKSIKVLQACEKFLPLVEDLKITSRCIDAVASKICHNPFNPTRPDNCSSAQQGNSSRNLNDKAVIEWWANDVCTLHIDLFQKVLMALKAQGMQTSRIAGVLMHYAHCSLKIVNGIGDQHVLEQNEFILAEEHGQRIVLEIIVNLLPVETDIIPIGFLFGLLRAAIVLDSTVACKLDLEKRIGSQLEEATVEELLIPSLSHHGATIFDTDIVQRLLIHFLEQKASKDLLDSHASHASNELSFRMPIRRVANLIDAYLAEVAPDVNLTVSKFVSLAELLPVHARAVHDGIYRAIDIYLKAHSTIPDIERKNICKLMDCQKLSQEACSHAAQNERLPVYLMVQVLYLEQLGLRSAVSGSFTDGESLHPLYISQRMSRGTVSATMSPREKFVSLAQENDNLRHEVSCMRRRLNELEKQQMNDSIPAIGKTSSAKKFLSSFSRRLSKINPFLRFTASNHDHQQEHQGSNFAHQANISKRRRRHSLS